MTQDNTRILLLDVLRGVAVFGMLTVNITWIALPSGSEYDPTVLGTPTVADQVSWFVTQTLFEGKMRATFSILFGVSFWMTCSKAQSKSLFYSSWHRRCLWLILFGIIHAYLLLWRGDILFSYGVSGLLLFTIRNQPTRRLVLFALLMLVAASLVAQISAYREQLDVHGSISKLTTAYSSTPDLSGGGCISTVDDADERPIALEIATARSGYRTNVLANAPRAFDEHTAGLLSWSLWDVLPLMILGLVAARRNLPFALGHYSPSYLRFGALCLLLGSIPTVYLDAYWWSLGFSDRYRDFGLYDFWYHIGRATVAVGYICLIASAVALTKTAFLWNAIAAVGRLALTNYILQTLICITLFFGFGFGQFSALSRTQLWLVVISIWLFQVLFSLTWLRLSGQGPLERLLRSLAAPHLGRPA